MNALTRLVALLGVGSGMLWIVAPISQAQQTVPETPQQAVAPSPSPGESKPPEETAGDASKSASFWMDQKLRLSKELLAGLAKGDFESLGKNAELMRGLNRVELFIRREPEGYRDELRLFNMANEAMIRAATDENLEAATLAFNQLTISCVSCHKHLREHP